MKFLSDFSRTNWLTSVLFPLTVLFTEVFWIFPWLVWLQEMPDLEWTQPPLTLQGVFFIIGISFLSSRFFLAREWSMRRIRAAIIACGILAVFVVIRTEYEGGYGLLDGGWFVYITRTILDGFRNLEPLVIALGFSVFLWWRGISLGRSLLMTSDINRTFMVGIGSFVLLILVSGATVGADFLFSLSSVWTQIAGFFFFGLLAIALSNLKTVRKKMSAEDSSAVLDRRWFSVLLAVIGGLITLGMATASIISVGFIGFITGAFGAVSDFFVKLFGFLFLPIGYLVEGLWYVMMWVISRLFRNTTPPEGTASGEMPEMTDGMSQVELPPEVLLVLKWVFIIVVAGLVLFLIGRAVFRYSSTRKKEAIDESHESLLSRDLLKEDLQLFLNGLRDKLRRKKKPGPPQLPIWYGDDYSGTLSIRQIYEVMLWNTARGETPRREYETPEEYSTRLGSTVPEGSDMLGDITGYYEETRYGEIDLPREKVAGANSAWKALRRLLAPTDNKKSDS